MKVCRLLFIALLATLVVSTGVQAAHIPCSDGPGLDLTEGCQAEGNDNQANVEAAILAATGTAVDLTLYGKSDDDPGLFDITSDDPEDLSGTWAVLDGTAISYLSVKAGPNFAVYSVTGSSGSWTTEGLLVGGGPNGGNQPGLSHLSFWTTLPDQPPPPGEIPEPGTISLLGMGLLALGYVGWRRRKEA